MFWGDPWRVFVYTFVVSMVEQIQCGRRRPAAIKGEAAAPITTTASIDKKRNPGGSDFPTHVFETRIRIRLPRDTQKLALIGWMRNLSEGGLTAFVADALALGKSVVL